MFHYSIYGLHIASEIECPELCMEELDSVEACVHIYSTSQNRTGNFASVPDIQAIPNGIQIDVPGVARYQILDGSEIVIERDSQAADETVRLFLLGSAFGAILHQRGMLPIHGSAVAHPYGAAIISAPRGYGKSTLAAALALRGFPLMADDMCAISTTEDDVWLYPAYPRVNLLQDAVTLLNLQSPVSGEKAKLSGRIPPKYSIAQLPFFPTAQRLTAIYTLSIGATSDIHLRLLHGYSCISELTGNTYRVQYARYLGTERTHLKQVTQLAKQVRVVQVIRPDDIGCLEEVVAAIAKDIQTQNQVATGC